MDRAFAVIGERAHPFRSMDVARSHDEVGEALAWLARSGCDDPQRFHVEPSPLNPADASINPTGRPGMTTLVAPSPYEPPSGLPGGDRWRSYEANRTFHVRLLEHRAPSRRWVIAVHGTGMGHDLTDLRAFQVGWMHRVLGVNVALPVLPLSGPRRNPGLAIQFPTSDQLDSLHGLSQAIAEIRQLSRWLRQERGAEEITLYGISLGGYVVAAASAVDPEIDRVIAGVPASDLHRLFVERLDDRDEAYRALLEDGRRLHRVVDPLTLDPLVPVERRFIYGGLADQMAHRKRQAVPLWEHWGRPARCWYPGGHLAFMRSPQVARFVERAMAPPLDQLPR